jgi:cysteine desulfurase
MKPIYLDYAATTPVDPRVSDVMLRYLNMDGIFGNPASSTHIFGQNAAEAVNTAREKIAAILKADPREIIFTSGATESNNLAIKGLAQFYRSRGNHIITVKTEHKAVLHTCEALAKDGFKITYLSVDKRGLIDLEELEQAITDKTLLVSIMHVNNETGTIQDILKIAALVKKKGVFFHTDAAQSIGKLNIDLQKMPIDLLSFSGHKIYAPKGIGVLFVRRTPRVKLLEQISGGHHEEGMRSGTLATHQITALAMALELMQTERDVEQACITTLRNQLWDRLKALPNAHLNGDLAHTLPNILNITFDDVNNIELMEACPELAFSAGSACQSASITPSHVLTAMGITKEQANNTVRFSLGRYTTESDIETAANLLIERIT